VALDLSYRHLPADRRRLLRLAALHPGQDLDAHAAAALTGADPAGAGERLRALHRDHLLLRTAPGRYGFHDLVRAYAVGRAADEDPPPQRRAALTRLFDHYLAATAAATDLLHPAGATPRPRVPPPATPLLVPADADGARRWLETEQPTLVAVAVHTAAHGWPAHTTRLSRTLFRHLGNGHTADAVTVHTAARDAARSGGDPVGHGHALTDLAVAYLRLGRFGPAAEQFRQALGLFRAAGDPAGRARALTNLCILRERLGHGPGPDHAEALGLYRQAGNRTGEAMILSALGSAEVHQGRFGPAAEHLRRSLRLHRELGDPHGEAWALTSIGRLHAHAGRPAEAELRYRRAADGFRAIGARDGESCALNGLGEAARALGRTADARAHHAAALALAEDIGAPDEQARAHAGLGHAALDLGDDSGAGRSYRAALALYAELGMPAAEAVRARLATLDDTAGAHSVTTGRRGEIGN
jgi:tetratricopeptide (TPR) repeat protein